jgi:hypothetical protein
MATEPHAYLPLEKIFAYGMSRMRFPEKFVAFDTG